MNTPTSDPWAPADWRTNAPRMLLDPKGPRGEDLPTPLDRRWLWRVESVMAVCAPLGSELDKLRQLLTAYLQQTCEHHWLDYDGDEDIPAHRQCLWCNDVEWPGDASERSS